MAEVPIVIPGLSHISRIVSLLPLNLNNPEYPSIFGKIYCIFIIILICALHTFNMYIRNKYYYEDDFDFSAIQDITLYTFLALVCSSFVLQSTFFNEKAWRVLIVCLKSKHPLKFEEKSLRQHLMFNFCFLNFLYLSHVFFEFYSYSHVYSGEFYLAIAPVLIEIYMILLSSLNINNFANLIKNKIIELRLDFIMEHESLKDIKKTTKDASVCGKMFVSCTSLNTSFENYLMMVRVIRAFNQVYGKQILGTAGIILIFLTDNVRIIIIECGNIEYDYYDILLSVLAVKCWNCFNLIIFAILLVSPCVRATKEINKLLVVCSKLLIDIPKGTDDRQLLFIKEKMLLLIGQLKFYKPYFTAAGYFEVNYIMLLYIFNGVTSFVVVYIQLTN